MIDPGHGGIDKGASNHHINESDINLKVSLYLFKLLKKNPRFEVHLTRSKDEFLSLNQRAHRANEKKADALISIHVNASKDKTARGTEIYFQNQIFEEERSLFLAKNENKGKSLQEEILKRNILLSFSSLNDLNPQILSILYDLTKNYKIFLSSLLAKSIAKNWSFPLEKKSNSIQKKLKHQLLSVRQAPFFVISHVQMPSVLIELGYITNKEEALKLNQKTFQQEQAQKIYLGLLNYKKTILNHKKK